MKKEQRQPPRRTFLKQSGILLATFNLFYGTSNPIDPTGKPEQQSFP